jgi:hypothetical protein
MTPSFCILQKYITEQRKLKNQAIKINVTFYDPSSLREVNLTF